MLKHVSIEDVARTARVSISTVSRVLNENPKVNREMSERVQKAMKDLNYIPNIHARNIRGKTSNTIGCVLPSVSDNFYSGVLEGIIRYADYCGINVQIISYHGDPSKEINCLHAAAASGINGLLYCPSSDVAAEQLQYIFQKQFPIVIVYRRDLVLNIPHIYHDNIQGGYLATKYLLMHGHRHIAFFIAFWESPCEDINGIVELLESPKIGAYSSLDRLVGHIRALEEFNVPFDRSLMYLSGYDYVSGYKSAKGFLSTLCEFDAVICGNDSVAAGVLQALREQNIVVPDQVSLIGYDDSVLATIARPMLTSIRQEPVQLGYESVEMITELMEGKEVSNRVLDVNLVIRNSTSVKKKY